jgi:hypothetical protein
MRIDEEKAKLFRLVRTQMGAPIRPVQLTDEQLCDLLEIVVQNYAEKVQNWIIKNQWMTLYGKQISTTDMAYALSVRTLDMSKDYSYWFSKEVGLQQRGPWELKKDYITIEQGKQVYMIPAGREINKVLYTTPPTSQAALFANYAGIDIGFGGGYAQIGAANSTGGPLGGFYTMPAYDTFLLAADMNLKNRLLRSDLTYKVTAGPDGTRLLHLISTPGSKLSFGYVGGVGGGLSLIGCQVWYTYYDVDSSNVDDCRKQNPDILISPDQVPLEDMDYSFLNSPTKTIVRQLLVAEAKILLGNIRGTFSGKVSIPEAELMLDYNMLLDQGKEEKREVIEALEKRLEAMDPVNMLKNQSDMADSLNNILRKKPLGMYVI